MAGPSYELIVAAVSGDEQAMNTRQKEDCVALCEPTGERH